MIKDMNGNKGLELEFYAKKILYDTDVPEWTKAWEVTWETMFWKADPG